MRLLAPRRPRGRRRPWNPSKPDATAADPTPQRLAKEPQDAWDRHSHPGGQVAHQIKTVLEVHKAQFTESEYQAMEYVQRLAERADAPQLISSIYSGMGALRGVRSNGHAANESQLRAREELVGILRYLVEIDTAGMARGERRGHGFCTVALGLMLGVRDEATGESPTLVSVGARATTWDDKASRKGVGLGLMRATAWTLRYARVRAGEAMRDRRRYLATQQEAFEHGRQVERFDQADRDSRKRKMEAEVESYFRKARSQSA